MKDPFNHMDEATKHIIDFASIATVLGTLADVLPAIAALFTIVWTSIRIYETKTVQGWLGKKMPSKSKKQHNLMAAVAKNPAFAKKVGIKQSVGEEFLQADKGKKFGTGGDVNYSYGGQNQIGKQRTRFGSTFGYKNNIPNANLNKYVGKKEGGLMKHDDIKQDMPMMKKVAKQEVASHEKKMHKMKGGGYVRAADGITKTGKTKGTMIKMCMGGKTKAK